MCRLCLFGVSLVMESTIFVGASLFWFSLSTFDIFVVFVSMYIVCFCFVVIVIV